VQDQVAQAGHAGGTRAVARRGGGLRGAPGSIDLSVMNISTIYIHTHMATVRCSGGCTDPTLRRKNNLKTKNCSDPDFMSLFH
jgi:hypothetical protein